MSVDTLSIVVKAIGYIALLQAAGIALFRAAFGSLLDRSSAHIRTMGTASALIALVAFPFYQLLEAARMTGEYADAMNAGLQLGLLGKGLGAATGLRVLGAALMCAGVRRATAGWTLVGVMGASLAISSFLLVGHSVTQAPRWAIVPMLEFHLLVAAFWFGSIAPMIAVATREPAVVSHQIVDRFSSVAGLLVPALAVVGVGMAWLLIGGSYSLSDPYSLAITGKLLLFVVLLALAALNRWRLGPALRSGTPQARRSFVKSLVFEYALLVGVLALTAALTNLYSPALPGS